MHSVTTKMMLIVTTMTKTLMMTMKNLLRDVCHTVGLHHAALSTSLCDNNDDVDMFDGGDHDNDIDDDDKEIAPERT